MSTLMQKGDVGVVLDVTVRQPPTVSTDSDGIETTTDGDPVNLSPATVIQIVLGPPVGEPMIKDASFDPAYLGTDGRLLYETIEDDISVAGVWSIQAYWEVGASVRRSTVTTFEVLANIE